MPVALPTQAHRYFDQAQFATLATLEPDGRPQLSVVWIKRDGDDVLVSTVKGRRKHRNLERDARATVLVYDKDDPYHYVELRGTTTMADEGGRQLIDDLCQKYRGITPYPWDGPDAVRVVVRISADKVVVH
ncbi:MAG: PPOX class F420-dependent oxidoreductase [Actinomycetes bacterium]